MTDRRPAHQRKSRGRFVHHERRKLERPLRMGSSYVLDFSGRTFNEFFEWHARRDATSDKHKVFLAVEEILEPGSRVGGQS